MAPYCGCFYQDDPNKAWSSSYLPQVDLNVHATILSTTSRTTLTQTFLNPSKSKALKEVSYAFPLYDGVSVVGFTCRIGERVLKGKVKAKDQANKEYQQAVSQGQTATILDQSHDASDSFLIRVGNVPADGTVVVEITFIGELNQDAQTNAVRYTLPSVIAPRYGQQTDRHMTSSGPTAVRGGVSIIVDVSVEKGSVIRSVQSPSHPINVCLGRTSTMSASSYEMHCASADLRLSTGNAFLDRDFVALVVADGLDTPFALLESHPTLPEQKALMLSLVPKFDLPRISPEIVFVIDRSGSMGDKIPTLQSALRVFLKSLPVGVRFNICSFGSDHAFLWPRNRLYDEDNLHQALAFVHTIDADMGGTEILEPVRAVVENRFPDLELEVLLLTDGQIWDQGSLFSFVRDASQSGDARFFTLGIGDAASHSLIEGIARAGNGFSQSVVEYQELDAKVVRMLKGALLPHIQDYKLELQPSAESDHNDFEMIDSATEDTSDTTTAKNESPENKDPQAPILLYDSAYKEPHVEINEIPADLSGNQMPKLDSPRVLQAPTKIPALYPFIRSTVYILFSCRDFSGIPSSVTLRASSKYGPLQVEIPVQDVGGGETVHQLAARRAVMELEEGRGWLQEAKNDRGELVKDAFASKFEQLVTRECQHLGARYQVAGKWCSFVAVEGNGEEHSASGEEEQSATIYPAEQVSGGSMRGNYISSMATGSLFCAPSFKSAASPVSSPSPPPALAKSASGECRYSLTASDRGMSKGSPSSQMAPMPPTSHFKRFSADASAGGVRRGRSSVQPSGSPVDAMPEATSTRQKVQELISLQAFEGNWKLEDRVLRIIGLSDSVSKQELQRILGSTGNKSEDTSASLMTSLVIRYLEQRAADCKSIWELVKEKAEGWLQKRLAECEPAREFLTRQKDAINALI